MSTVPNTWSLLATFVQISDLHIGKLDAQGNAEVRLGAATAYATTPWFDGWLGHTAEALKQFADFWDQERTKDPNIKLIVTGDVTRSGAREEFENAKDYLHRRLTLDSNGFVKCGLDLGELDLIISGNHDHWNGSYIAYGAGPSQYSNAFADPIPRIHTPSIALANGRRVSFFCVNSDRDVDPFSTDRQYARGDFRNELTEPQFIPAVPCDPLDIRVMLIHHSWHQSGNFLRMRSQSKSDLAEFLGKHDFKAILTGHSHDPLLATFTVPCPDGAMKEVVELRAGTVTQLDEIPNTWKPLLAGFSRQTPLPDDTFLVHRLYDDGANGTRWEATVWRRTRKHGFEADPLGRYTKRFQV